MNDSSGVAIVEGRRIRFWTRGAGPPVVLVHGWGSSYAGNWLSAGWSSALARERLVIGLDVRGHGESDKPLDPACYSYGAMASDVIGVLDALNVRRADFIGYSMGSFMGAWLLGHAPERFRRFVLGGIGAETEASRAVAPRIAEALRATSVEAIDDPLGRSVRAFTDAQGALGSREREALAVSALRMWPEGDPVAVAGPGLARVRTPVLVVVGAQDHPYVDTVGAFCERVPGSECVIVPGCDHLSLFDDPTFLARTQAFLAEVSSDDP